MRRDRGCEVRRADERLQCEEWCLENLADTNSEDDLETDYLCPLRTSAESSEERDSDQHHGAAGNHEQRELSVLPDQHAGQKSRERQRNDQCEKRETGFERRKLQDDLIVQRQEKVASDEDEAVQTCDDHDCCRPKGAKDMHWDQRLFRKFGLVPDEDAERCDSEDQRGYRFGGCPVTFCASTSLEAEEEGHCSADDEHDASPVQCAEAVQEKSRRNISFECEDQYYKGCSIDGQVDPDYWILSAADRVLQIKSSQWKTYSTTSTQSSA